MTWLCPTENSPLLSLFLWFSWHSESCFSSTLGTKAMPSQRKVKSTPSWCSLCLLSLHSRSYSQASPFDKDGDIAGSPLVPVQCDGRSADWPNLKHLDSGWGGDPRHLLRGSGQGERCLYSPSAPLISGVFSDPGFTLKKISLPQVDGVPSPLP